MADVEIGAHLTLDANDGINSIKEFRKQLKEAQGDAVAMAEKFGATSKEAALAAQKVALLKDQMEESRKLVDAFNPDTKFRALGAALNTAVGGFTALQGIMGLVGVESKELQQSLQQVQSAMALSQGIAQFQEGIKTFKNLASVIQQTTIFQKANAAATKIAAVTMKLFGVAADTTSTSFKVLKGAIAATGIGLIVVAIGTLLPLISDWISGTDDAAAAQERLNVALERQQDLLKSELEGIDYVTKARVAKAKIAGKTEAEITEIENQGALDRVNALKENSDKLQAIAADSNDRKLEDQQKADKASLDAYQAYLDAVSGYDLMGLEKRAAAAEEGRRKAKEAAEKAAKERLERAKKDLEEQNRIAAARITGTVGVVREKSPEEVELDNKLAATKVYYDNLRELRKANTEDEYLHTKDLESMSRERIAQEETEYQNKKAVGEASAELLGALSDLVGKQTVAGKALAIAQATINTFLGATEVLRSKSVLPEPFGTIVKVASVATIIASGVSAIRNIVKTPVPGGGGGGSVPSMASVSAPLKPALATNQTTQLDQKSINAIGNATTRAFVLESDVTNNQERIRMLNRAARIG